jgi:hypothetical protein
MPECIHQLTLCASCGGLQVTEYVELNGVAQVDFADTNFQSSGETRVFWSPGPTPCEPDTPPSHNA